MLCKGAGFVAVVNGVTNEVGVHRCMGKPKGLVQGYAQGPSLHLVAISGNAPHMAALAGVSDMQTPCMCV